MSLSLSQRVQALKESGTLGLTARVQQLRAQGLRVIGFGVGQPDFTTPSHIREAAKRALDAGHTGYAIPSHGLREVREAVRRKFQQDYQVSYGVEEIMITVGAKEALYLAFLALLNEGDEVILPAPYWVSYPEQIRLAQGCPVIVHGRPENDFRLTPGELDAALTPRTRIVILNYPSNPGGFTYSRRDLLQLAEVLEGRSLIVISDEMYDRLTYGRDAHACFASLSRHAWEHTLVVNAPSKSYAMTGWRLGYAAGPEPLIKAMSKIQSQTTSGTCHFAQFGLAEALTADQKCVDEMRATFDRRRQLMYRGLCGLKDVTCVEPRGAFYCFPDVSATYDRLGVSDSDGFSQRVLDEVHVAVVPGSAFGCDRHVRLAYATGDEDIIEGLSRLKRLLG